MKAEIDIEDAKEAADEQARADDKHARERHFRNNQSAANPCVAVALAGAAIGVLESVVEIDAGDLEGGEKTEDDTGENGDEAVKPRRRSPCGRWREEEC